MMPNPMQMIFQFPQFMQQMMGQDPQQLLNQLVQSGRVNQQQLNQAQQMAQQMQGQFEQFRGMFGSVAPFRARQIVALDTPQVSASSCWDMPRSFRRASNSDKCSEIFIKPPPKTECFTYGTIVAKMEREFHIWGFTKRLCGVYGGIATGKGHTSLPAAKPRHLVARAAGQFKKFSKSPNQSGLLDT